MTAALAVDELKNAPALDVVLESIDSLHKYRTIEAMVNEVGLSIGDAAALGDKVPGVLIGGVSQEKARNLVASFGDLGATLSFTPSTLKVKAGARAEAKPEAKPEGAAAAAPSAGAVEDGPGGLAKVPTGIADCLVKGPDKARVVLVELTDYQ